MHSNLLNQHFTFSRLTRQGVVFHKAKPSLGNVF